jgi:hypothetical protein
MYAAAAGSAMALTTSLTASIIYSGLQNVTAKPSFVQSGGFERTGFRNIDIDGQGNSFHIAVRLFSGSFDSRSGSVTLDPGGCQRSVQFGYPICSHPVGRQMLGSGNNLRRLAFGAEISSGQPGFGASHYLVRRLATSGIGRGTWPPAPASGFVGVKFIEDGATHFGWIRLKFGGEPGLDVPSGITAVDWAYNTVAGAPIRAGQTRSNGDSDLLPADAFAPSSGPEPSNKALAVLSAGSLGLLAWRKRRRELAPKGTATDQFSG